MINSVFKLFQAPAQIYNVCFWTMVLFLALVSGGCATASYTSHAAAGPAKPDDFPIPVYREEVNVPRPCEVIGIVSVNPGGMTMFGGDANKEMEKIMRKAHQKGADAVKMVAFEKPDFANPNYRMTAELLRYTDQWETIPVSEKQFQAYLDANRRTLDPIEGVWVCDEMNGTRPYTVAIMKNHAKPGREFVGFILDSKNPLWKPGYKKMDIRHDPETGGYDFTFYFDDFARAEVPIYLHQRTKFSVDFQKDEEHHLVTYTKQ